MDFAQKNEHPLFYSKDEIPDNTLFFSLQLTENNRQHPDSNYLLKFKGELYDFFEKETPVLLAKDDSFFINERLNNIQAINITDEDFHNLSKKFFDKLLSKNQQSSS